MSIMLADFLLGHQLVADCRRARSGRFGSNSPISMRPGVVSKDLGRLVALSRSTDLKRPLILVCSVTTPVLSAWCTRPCRRRPCPRPAHSPQHHRQVVEAENDVLRRHDDRRTVGRVQDVVGRHHQHAGFQLRFQRKRHVDRHLVAVEVGVERRADQRVQLDRLALDQDRLERLDAKTVQRRRAVQQHRVLADHLVEDVPDFRLLFSTSFLACLTVDE